MRKKLIIVLVTIICLLSIYIVVSVNKIVNRKSFELEYSKVYCYVGDNIPIGVINNKGIKWNSEDSLVANMGEDGFISCNKVGQTNITAKKSIKSSNCEVIVLDKSKVTEKPENVVNEKYIEIKKEIEKEKENNTDKEVDIDYNNNDSNSIPGSNQEDSNIPENTNNNEGASSNHGEDKSSIPGSDNKSDNPVVNPTEPTTPTGSDKPVVNPTEPEKPVVNPSEPEKPVVKPSEPEKPVVVTSVKVDKTSVDLFSLDTYKISASVTPSNANSSLTYKSSDTSILTVDKNGNVKALKSGSAYVTVTSNNNKSAKVTFNIASRERIHFISHLEATGTDHITGDAILLESNGYFAMIDVGHKDEKVRKHIINYLKDNGVKSLDFLLLTHTHSDHANTFMIKSIVNNNIRIKNIWMRDYSDSFYSEAAERFNSIKNIISNNSGMISNVKYVSRYKDGTIFTFKNLKFKMTLYNLSKNVNGGTGSDNYNSIASLIEVNNHRVLLTGDFYDTLLLNNIAKDIKESGKNAIIFKVPHHGSRMCALLPKNYNGNKVNKKDDNIITSTAIADLKSRYFIVTSSRKKIENIKNEFGEDMCVDVLPTGGNNEVYYVDESPNALVIDLSYDAVKGHITSK